ncbi:MAG: hypothetical protein KGL50_06095 [Burkholderiales bacterium]|nr:hypothetical protein [Burkholderiales bacterium]
MADRFALMIAWLSGLPAPSLPALLGRVHRLREFPRDSDPGIAELRHAEIWRALAREIPPPHATEAGQAACDPFRAGGDRDHL